MENERAAGNKGELMIDLDELAHAAYVGYLAHEFEDDVRIIALKIFMEASELAEDIRAAVDTDFADHIGDQGFSKQEEELADIILLVLIMAGKGNLRITEAIKAKHKYNQSRPKLHGKKW